MTFNRFHKMKKYDLIIDDTTIRHTKPNKYFYRSHKGLIGLCPHTKNGRETYEPAYKIHANETHIKDKEQAYSFLVENTIS